MASSCCIVYLQTKQGKPAQSTVQLEVEDNLFLLVTHFHRKTGGLYPVLVLDNIRIQDNVADDVLDSRYGWLSLPTGSRIRIPTHSPDCNQVVEHVVAAVKDGVAGELYHQALQNPVITAEQLTHMGKAVFDKFKNKQLYKDGVAANVAKLPDVWGLIATPVDQQYQTTTHKCPSHNRTYTGTGGDWAPSGWR